MRRPETLDPTIVDFLHKAAERELQRGESPEALASLLDDACTAIAAQCGLPRRAVQAACDELKRARTP
ncbi:MAG: hypothetical protein HY691_06200 [Chloroflexi bacterium]|nr:hypothetical protein [Chloroflexota bacterium]